eukprot:gene4481-6725_t
MAEDPSTSSDESWDGALPRVLSTCNNVQETSLDIGQFFIEDIDGLLLIAESQLRDVLQPQPKTPKFVQAWEMYRRKDRTLTISRDSVQKACSDMIPCVGCRRSVTKFLDFLESASTPHYCIEPLHVTSSGSIVLPEYFLANQDHTSVALSCRPNLSYTTCCTNTSNFLDPHSKKKRCELHKVESTVQFEKSDNDFWLDHWRNISPECQKKLMTFKEPDVYESLIAHLQKLCVRCRQAVEAAYVVFKRMEWSDHKDPTVFYKEKCYDPIIFEGLSYDRGNHIVSVSPERDYLVEIINFARRETIRTERHAESNEKAQTEIVIMMGKLVWKRLWAVHQRLLTGDQTVMMTYELLAHCLLSQLLNDSQEQAVFHTRICIAEQAARDLLALVDQKHDKMGKKKKRKGKKKKGSESQQQKSKQTQPKPSQQQRQQQQLHQNRENHQQHQQQTSNDSKHDSELTSKRESVDDEFVQETENKRIESVIKVKPEVNYSTDQNSCQNTPTLSDQEHSDDLRFESTDDSDDNYENDGNFPVPNGAYQSQSTSSLSSSFSNIVPLPRENISCMGHPHKRYEPHLWHLPELVTLQEINLLHSMGWRDDDSQYPDDNILWELTQLLTTRFEQLKKCGPYQCLPLTETTVAMSRNNIASIPCICSPNGSSFLISNPYPRQRKISMRN